MRKRSDTLSDFAAPVDLLYVGAMLLAFITLYFVSYGLMYSVYFVLMVSLVLDWLSARVALRRDSMLFLVLDLITSFNYISLFIVLTLSPSPPLKYSKMVWLQYGLLFLIYVIWNIVMMCKRGTDAKSKKFFARFLVAEIPAILYAMLIFMEFNTRWILAIFGVDILAYGDVLLLLLTGYHLGIIGAWTYQTYLKHT